MATWTEESRKKVVDAYLAENPTPETSTEIIKAISDETGESVNAIRMILTQQQVYVKKTPAAVTATAAKASTEGTGKRVSKEQSIAALTKKLEDLGAPIDTDIIEKLTGKAAVYFLSVVEAIQK